MGGREGGSGKLRLSVTVGQGQPRTLAGVGDGGGAGGGMGNWTRKTRHSFRPPLHRFGAWCGFVIHGSSRMAVGVEGREAIILQYLVLIVSITGREQARVFPPRVDQSGNQLLIGENSIPAE